MQGGTEVQEGGGICILTADSRCCMAETNTTFKAIILPIKYFIKGSETGDQPNLHFEESKGKKKLSTLYYTFSMVCFILNAILNRDWDGMRREQIIICQIRSKQLCSSLYFEIPLCFT